MFKVTRIPQFALLLAILAGLVLTACQIVVAPDVIPPTVASVVPADAATDVAINSSVVATFSEGMDAATITADTFILTAGATGVAGAVAYDAASMTASFTPAANLEPSTVYTATIGIGAKDAAGNALAAAMTWSFTTGVFVDTTAPTVVSTSPADGANGVSTGSAISFTFSEAVNPATLTGNVALSPTAAGAVTIDVTNMIATFTPTSALVASTTYTMTIGTGVADVAGNTMAAAKVWSFTTSGLVSSKFPAAGDTNVGRTVNGNIRAIFSTDMLPTTVVNANFTVALANTPFTPVVGTVTYDVPNKTAIFAPSTLLDVNTMYKATLTTDVHKLDGTPMAAAEVWTFTTIAAAGAGPNPVVLETAGNYALLAYAGITNVVPSEITGNLGVSPGAASTITNFSLVAVGTSYATSTQVVGGGNVYAADYAGGTTAADLTKAGTDKGTAYTDGMALKVGHVDNIGAGTLGASTAAFAPGTYWWTNTLFINGDITITGGPNDIWIFQIPGNLTVDSGSAPSHPKVILSGGARAQNIFWVVGGAATIGTYDEFAGIILSAGDVHLMTGAVLIGRAFSNVTQITLDKATVTQPTP